MTEETTAPRPFVKWIGGKRNIIEELKSRMPGEYSAYFEPFVGGGALFWDVLPENAHLSDINLRLVVTYAAIRDRVNDVIIYLKKFQKLHSEAFFYNARTRLSEVTDAAELAALFIYLNRTCYNGMYRVNKKGGFNVPIGKYENPLILDEPNLRACHEALQGVSIMQRPFWQHEPVEGAFYYFDPPYHSTFSGYSNDGFPDEAHVRLAEYCRLVDESGGFFMLSNSDDPFVRDLFRGYNVEEIFAGRSVSCKGEGRGKEKELVVRNY